MTSKDMGKKCKMTLSGKHRWRDYPDSFRSVKGRIGWYMKTICIPKCVACGMIDDRPTKLEGKR